jgi:hypothetical protein
MGGWLRKVLVTILMLVTLLVGAGGVAPASSAPALAGGIASSAARAMANSVRTSARTAVHNAERIEHAQLRLPVRAPRPIIVAEVEAASLPTRAYDRAVDMVDPYIQDLPLEEARVVVRLACAVKDGVDAVSEETLDQQLTSAGISFGGRATYHLRVRQLGGDMHDADFGDAAGQLAVFYICERV